MDQVAGGEAAHGTGPVVALDQVAKRFPQADGSELSVLQNATLAIGPGDTVSVAGPSGSGKSTLLHLAAGIEIPTEGTVRLLGQDLAALSDRARSRLRGESVGLIFQSFHLIPYLTVRENVLLPARILGVRQVPGADDAPEDAGAAAERLLRQVGLEARAREPSRTLSGGEMQRTAIARALLLRPALLLADEPTGSLDAGAGAVVTELLFRLVGESGSSLVLATHDPELAARCQVRLSLTRGELRPVRARRAA